MDYFYIAIYIFLGIAPSLLWLLYYLKKDLHPEPKKTVLKMYFYGALITIPVFCLQVWFSKILYRLEFLDFFYQYPIAVAIIKWFFIIALTEETLKYIGLRLTILKDGALDEPMDVMLYMVVVASGFAGLENILYLIPTDTNIMLQSVAVTALARFFGATLLHTLCSALLGYFLALSFLKTKQHAFLTILGIVLASTLHGLYDFSIITLDRPFNKIIPTLIIIGLGIFVIHAFDKIRKLKSICGVKS